MNKILLGLTALIVALTGLVFTLKHPPEALGVSQSNDVVKMGSTTQPVYIGVATGSDTRATTTGLTINAPYNYSRIQLVVQNTATGTAGTIGNLYIVPQTSYDAITWTDWQPSYLQTAAAQISSITLSAATDTIIVWAPNELGTTTRQFVFENLVGKYARFQVWGTGTTSVLLWANLQNN